MLELLKRELDKVSQPAEKMHRAREFLQVLTLKIISDQGHFKRIAFLGGTALRLLHDLRRYSEDLDFSLIKGDGFDRSALLEDVVRKTNEWGLPVEIKTVREKTVTGAWLKYPGLLQSLGLAALKDQKLSIKLEIDQNPPSGGGLETSLISREFTFPIVNFDLPSMFATKIHACFYRKYLKGRDFYDLVWYLGRKTRPNYPLLNNAVNQTEGRSPEIADANFKRYLLDKLRKYDLEKAKKDVEPFLFDHNELAIFNNQAVAGLVERNYF